MRPRGPDPWVGGVGSLIGQDKGEQLVQTRKTLEIEQNKLVAQAMDTDVLRTKLRMALSTLQTVPEDKRRPIYASVLKFAEIYPEKVRLGIYAPAMAAGAPASAAAAAALTPKNTNDTPGSFLRAGSTTVQFGARGGTRTPTPCGTGS